MENKEILKLFKLNSLMFENLVDEIVEKESEIRNIKDGKEMSDKEKETYRSIIYDKYKLNDSEYLHAYIDPRMIP
ncbi:MAG: hypothetical protein ACRDD7_15080 [Peptostreptococcaceae bacterium]